MALSDEVSNRYNAQQLLELTNPRNPEASSVDATQLGRACTAAIEFFETYAQQSYDETSQVHIETVVAGVIAKLQQWGGASASVAPVTWSAWKDDCRDLKNVGPRGHIVPRAGGSRTPTPETPDDEGRILPPFDSEAFRDTSLRSPAGSPEDD